MPKSATIGKHHVELLKLRHQNRFETNTFANGLVNLDAENFDLGRS